MEQLPDQLVCPYLGLKQDRSVTAAVATPLHRCYAARRPWMPDAHQQTHFCQTGNHSACPYYARARERGVATATSAPSAKEPFRRFGLLLLSGLVAVALAALLWFQGGSLLEALQTDPDVDEVAGSWTPVFAVSPSPESEALLPTPTPGPTSVVAERPQAVVNVEATRASSAGDATLTLAPSSSQVGWWSTNPMRQSYLGDSFLYSGEYDGDTFVAAIYFDLNQIPRGADIHRVVLELTGLRDDRLPAGSTASWLVQVIPETALSTLQGADFMTVYSAPASLTLLPQLQPNQVGAGQINRLEFDLPARQWLESQRLSGASGFTVRILGSAPDGDSLFAWDSGVGSETERQGPRLHLTLGPAPTEPPPLPTRMVLVATPTPVPENVRTVVAIAATATAQSETLGTPTPIPYEIVTPTPLPANLATVQAIALAQGLPPVVVDTPMPANAATAESQAAEATAVAMTTGTLTPVPADYVTPVLVVPSPPPENVMTAAARVVAATAQAAEGAVVSTPLPYNAVLAEWVVATPAPQNRETAVAEIQQQNAAAQTTGTPTPLPWNAIVYTPVPPPTPTDIPLSSAMAYITPTPTPTPTLMITANDLARFRGKLVFLSDRGSTEEAWVLDPATGEVVERINSGLVHGLAEREVLPWSPDGREQALVQEDHERIPQIKVLELEYDTVRQITNFRSTAYDPAWSPRGDQIAFVGTHTGNDEIFVTDPQGTTVTQLTHNTWEWDKHPTWSPDGSQIVFHSNRETGRLQLWIMNADGSNVRRLSPSEFNDWAPVWIP